MPIPFSRVASVVARRTRNALVQLAFLLIAAFCAVSLRADQAQTASNHNATRADFDRLMKELSNWGRWGKDDQMGAVNLITPAKRKDAVRAVRDGVSVSMARRAEIEQAIDNPRPINRVMAPRRGGGPGDPPPDISGASDTYTIFYHGLVHTHMDAFCHRAYKGLMFNGMPMTEVTEAACNKGSIFAWKDGILTRGVLMDIPRLKGVEYLEPGTRIYPEDLDAWVKQARLEIEPGDAVLIRTGRWALRDSKGPYNTNQLAGLYITCAKWLKDHDVAILGSDGAQDVHPSGIEGITEPIHALSLIAMGAPILDNLDLEAVAREAARRKRWDFLITASPVAVPGATGSVLNPIATF
jgi:kynurenine formamidase